MQVRKHFGKRWRKRVLSNRRRFWEWQHAIDKLTDEKEIIALAVKWETGVRHP